MAHRVPLAAVGLIKCTTLSPTPVPFSEVGSDTSKAPTLNVFGSGVPATPTPAGAGRRAAAWTVVAMKPTARNVAKAAVEIKDPTRIRTFLFMRFLPECVFENQVFDLTFVPIWLRDSSNCWFNPRPFHFRDRSRKCL